MRYFILVLFFSVSVYSHDSKEKHSEVSFESLEKLWWLSKDLNKISRYWQSLRQAHKELGEKGNMQSQLNLPEIYLYYALDRKKESDKLLSFIEQGMYWNLKALDQSFNKNACVFFALHNIETYSSNFNWYLKSPNPHKDFYKFYHLKDLFVYYYASKYMLLKLDFNKTNFQKSYYKLIADKIMKLRDEILKLPKKEKKAVWDLVETWEKKWGENLYSLKNSENCNFLRRKEQKEIRQKVVEIYLRD